MNPYILLSHLAAIQQGIAARQPLPSPLARSVATIIVPLTIIALAIPLILQKVPRNALYGFRTAFTMSSDEIWYYANRISGVALLLGGIFWLLLGRILPVVMRDDRSALRLISLLGAGALIAGCGVSYILTRRKYGKQQ